MKGTATKILLESIGESALSVTDLFVVFLEAGYGASYGKMEYLRGLREREREGQRAAREKERVAYARYCNLLYKLKRDGLIEKRGSSFLRLTEPGKTKLAKLRKVLWNAPSAKTYTAQKSKRAFLVVFDIPEAERKKRAWLRAVLRHLGYVAVQKSVWKGNALIPRDFLRDLRDLRLGPFVDIFEIKGTD